MSEPDFLPAADLQTLHERARLTRRLRDTFHTHGYWEVETPLWSRDTCVDAWIAPVACHMDGVGDGFLQTSPEFHMKRLLAGGADAIWSLTRSFRAGEAGAKHNPEFSIVEWYRLGETHHEAMTFTESLVRTISADSFLKLPPESFERITYDEAFEQAVGQRVLSLDVTALETLAATHVPEVEGPLDRDGWLNVLLAGVVEPWLATRGAVFLYDYPASQAALAKTRGEVAERFELYVDGVELANGYHELTDANELRKRFAAQNTKRMAAGLDALPVESRLLQAMDAGLPACAGVALGWDRLVMLCLGKTAIQDVITFPIDRA